MKIIGTNRLGYPELRNFANLSFENYKVKHCLDLYKVPSFVEFKLHGRLNQFHLNSFYDFELNRCDLFHFFNTLSFGKKPWITTFETFIPRWGDVSKKKIEKGLRLIAGNSCKKIIAISDCTANIQKQFISNYASHLLDEINEKMVIIHPPQVIMIEPSYQKSTDKIVFTIIGSGFIGKGGKEILTVFNNVMPKHPHVYLNIVSNFSDATKEEYDFCMNIIQKNERIIWYKSLPNNEVIDLLKKSHIGLLPTHAETYGYSVLEAQACGCPVISTDIRALSEINNEDCGWLIELPKDEMKNANNLSRYSNRIEEELHNIVINILNASAIIEQKRIHAIERIKTSHDPISMVKQLENIYDISTH